MFSCVHPGGQRVLAQQQVAKSGCICLTTWPQTSVSGQVSLFATSMSAMAQSCLFSLTQPQSPTTPCPYQRSCSLTGCCATGGPLPTMVTPLRGFSRQLFAESSDFLFGHAILAPATGSSWIWQCGHMLRQKPRTIYVISGTSWASTSEGAGCQSGPLFLIIDIYIH